MHGGRRGLTNVYGKASIGANPALHLGLSDPSGQIGASVPLVILVIIVPIALGI
jgi:hypothetical protein